MNLFYYYEYLLFPFLLEGLVLPLRKCAMLIIFCYKTCNILNVLQCQEQKNKPANKTPKLPLTVMLPPKRVNNSWIGIIIVDLEKLY